MANAVDHALDQYSRRHREDAIPETLRRAMRHSIDGGKRIRPLLVLAAGGALGSGFEPLLPFACAIELIHTYSLVHDDLPALDNDLLRRGKATCHVLFGEAAAILAGDALLAEAFLILSEARETKVVSDAALLEIITEIAVSAGARGLVGGQMLDVESEGKALDEAGVRKIHLQKTGSLMVTAVRVGAKVAGAMAEQLDRLSCYGRSVGLAFQIADDVLDVTAGADTPERRNGGDLQKRKATFATTLGVPGSTLEMEKSVEQALLEISGFDERADPLRQIARLIQDRVKQRGVNPWPGF